GYAVELDFGQGFFVVLPAVLVLIYNIHKLLDGVLSVPDNHCRQPLGDRADLAADYKYAVIPAPDMLFDNYPAAVPAGFPERLPDFVLAVQIEVNALALITVGWLDDNRHAELACGNHRRYFGVNHLSVRHRYVVLA